MHETEVAHITDACDVFTDFVGVWYGVCHIRSRFLKFLVMKRVILILMLASVAWVSGSAQDKMTRQERIDQWKEYMREFNGETKKTEQKYAVADTLVWLQALQALKDSSFVLEADAVTFKYGTRVQVNSTTNFISFRDGEAVVQISPSYSYAGPNGVGGITVDGMVSNVQITHDRKGRLFYTMNVQGKGISASVTISMAPGSNRAYAEVSPNFNSNTVRLEGYLVPYKFSNTIEGISF